MPIYKPFLLLSIAGALLLTGCSTTTQTSTETLSEEIQNIEVLKQRAEYSETQKYENVESFSNALIQQGFKGFELDTKANELNSFTIYHDNVDGNVTLQNIEDAAEIIVETNMIPDPDTVVYIQFKNVSLNNYAKLLELLEPVGLGTYLLESDTAVKAPASYLIGLQ